MRRRRTHGSTRLAMLVMALIAIGLPTSPVPPPERGAAPAGSTAQRPAVTEPSQQEPGPAVAAPGAPPRAAEAVVAARADGVEVVAGELLVSAAGDPEVLAERLRAELPRASVRRLRATGVLHVRLASEAQVPSARERLARMVGVSHVARNAVLRATGRERARGADLLWNLRVSGLEPRRGPGGEDARFVVALLDSGVAYRAHGHTDGTVHPASPGLAGVEIVSPWDAVDGDGSPDDEHGHGTFLANLMVGRPGLAGDAALMPVRVLDDDLVGTEAALVEGLAHAVMHGADVVNLSLVFGARYLPTRILDAAVADAVARGVVVVAASGNDGEPGVRYPAAFPGVVAVGASTPAGPGGRLERAGYSSWGAALDLLAPGGDLEADRNGDGFPDGVVAEAFGPDDRGTYGPWMYAGTSQAAAHASAAAVRLLAAGHPPAELPARLRETASDGALAGPPGFDPDSGGGALRLEAAMHRRVRALRVGVQAITVLRNTADGRAAGAAVAVVDRSGDPLDRATVHARFRGTERGAVSCVTDGTGLCLLDAGAVVTDPAVVVLEVQAVTHRDGRTDRPEGVVTERALDAVDDAISGGGWGSSSILWTVSPSWSSTWWSGATTSYLLFGSGEGSALPPTVVALGEDAAARLQADGTVVGGGWGASSITWLSLYWSSDYATFTWGGGWGASSILWSGWSYGWYLGGTTAWGAAVLGSPIHEVSGAFGAARAVAASVGGTP